MFVNISNHPCSKWSKEQKEAALAIGAGEIVDRPFPAVSPTATERALEKMASETVEGISSADAVHCMGEMGLTLKICNLLRQKQVNVFHSTTERIVEEKEGQKVVAFKFVQFRTYFCDHE